MNIDHLKYLPTYPPVYTSRYQLRILSAEIYNDMLYIEGTMLEEQDFKRGRIDIIDARSIFVSTLDT